MVDVLFKTLLLLAVILKNKVMEYTDAWLWNMDGRSANSSSKCYFVRGGLSYLGPKDLFSQCTSKRKCAKRNVPWNEFVLSHFSSGWQILEQLNKSAWMKDTADAEGWCIFPFYAFREMWLSFALQYCGIAIVSLWFCFRLWACRRWEASGRRLGTGRKGA